MAQYLIVHEGGELQQVEAKNVKDAATQHLLNEETAMIYRLAGPGKTVTASVEKQRRIEIT